MKIELKKEEKEEFSHCQKRVLVKRRGNRFVPLYFLLLSIMSSCSTFKVSKANNVEAINLLMDKWHKNATDANFEAYFNVFNGPFIGTDKTENWTNAAFKKFSKPFFENNKTWDFKRKERNIYFSKDKKIAWFDELLNTWMGVCRGSGVLEREQGSWKIKHYVLSVTVPNDEMSKVIAIKNNLNN